MCHNDKVEGLPEPGIFEPFNGAISGFLIGDEAAVTRLALLTDIYGCNGFYRAFATRYAGLGARVHLIDIFAEHGELPEVTREAAFARRHKLRDKAFVDALEPYLAAHGINAVIGFCFGGLCVYDLVRRDYPARMVSIYGFPQGLANEDPLPVPLTYLEAAARRHLSLLGGQDPTIPGETVAAIRAIAARNPAVGVEVFEAAGHGFMNDLGHEEAARRQRALTALKLCDQEIFG